MNPRSHHRARAWALLACLSVLTACQPKVTPVEPLTAEESRRIDALTQRMTPRCVGRYRFELPSAFVPAARLESHRTEVEGVTLQAIPMSLSRFEDAFEVRRMELAKMTQVGRHSGLPHLRAVLPLPNAGKGGVFDRAESINDRGGRAIELLSWRDGFEVKALIEALDLSFPEVASDSLSKKLKSDFNEKLAHLLSLHERIRGRRDDEVPDEPGFCFLNGFVRGQQLEHEMATVSYSHKEVESDTKFTAVRFTHANDVGPDKTLLERKAAFEDELKRSQGATLRRGSREGHGLKYEEWLMSKVSSERGEEGVTYFDLRAEMNSRHGNIQAPLFMIEATSQLTLTAAESVALWDRITATLRPQTKTK